MKTLKVELGERSYPILIGQELIGSAHLITPYLKRPRAIVVSNDVVAPLYMQTLSGALTEAGIHVERVILPDGEQFKDWQTLNAIFDALLGSHCERSTTLIALGGGVIGDMAGFAAACYQRGMPFVQIPTTLLAQVDSSVGGKTAINHPLGKNMIGAFYQPEAVIIDTRVLDTLPERQLKAGLAEVIKYGLIRDRDFLGWIEKNLDELLARNHEALAYAIHESCRNKAEVVAMDERESGVRALLNLGHTFGHAIETGMGYGNWLHGEAVSAGTMMAAELSRLLGWIDATTLERVEALFARAGLPVRGPAMDIHRYLELMAHDKKVIDGRLNLVLLRSLGRAEVADDCAEALVRAAIAARSDS